MKTHFATICFVTGTLLSPVTVFAHSSGSDSRHHAQSILQQNHHWEQSEPIREQTQGENLPTASVPEPGSIALLGAGLIGMYAARRSKK